MNFKVRKLATILAVPLWRRVWLRHRVAPGVEHKRALQNLGSISTVVDVGANRGQFSSVARELFPDAGIVAFEPLAEPAAKFRRVFANDSRVRLHNVAIGPVTMCTQMHVSARDDSSSLLPIGEAQSRIFGGTQETSTAAVEVCRLEEVLKPEDIVAPALLKLDVQGYELETLRGCESLLLRFVWVYCECSFLPLYEGQTLADEVIAWLHDNGFALRGVYNMYYDRDGRAVQADFLFVRASAPNA